MDIPALGTQYVLAPVRAEDIEGGNDPSADAVSFVFITDLAASPTTDDIVGATGGSWEPGGGPVSWNARCLVGPDGDVTLAIGTYIMWVQITDDPEAPLLKSGVVRVL